MLMVRLFPILLCALLTALAVACAVFFWAFDEGQVSAVEPPELRPAPKPYAAARSTYLPPEIPDVRVGDFDRPDDVPAYQVLQMDKGERDGVRGVTMTVDTQVTKERDLTLVARDLKARYADLDAVSVEFIDSEDFLDYRGGAVIFNTAAGAYYEGFVYGPPNNKGYLVNAAD